MEIDYDKDFEKVMTELQTNFGWSNIDVLPDSYKELLNDTIRAVKNCSIHDVSKSLPTKEYEIDFGGDVLAGLEITNNEPKIIGAMNGWGNGISKDKIIITEK